MGMQDFETVAVTCPSCGEIAGMAPHLPGRAPPGVADVLAAHTSRCRRGGLPRNVVAREIDPRSALAEKMAASAFPVDGIVYTLDGLADALGGTLRRAQDGYGGRHVVAVFARIVDVGGATLGDNEDARLGYASPLRDGGALIAAAIGLDGNPRCVDDAALKAAIAGRRVALSIILHTPEPCALTCVLPPLGQTLPVADVAALDVIAHARAEWIVSRVTRGDLGTWLRLRRLDTLPRPPESFRDETVKFAPGATVALRDAAYRKRPTSSAIDTVRR